MSRWKYLEQLWYGFIYAMIEMGSILAFTFIISMVEVNLILEVISKELFLKLLNIPFLVFVVLLCNLGLSILATGVLSKLAK